MVATRLYYGSVSDKLSALLGAVGSSFRKMYPTVKGVRKSITRQNGYSDETAARLSAVNTNQIHMTMYFYAPVHLHISSRGALLQCMRCWLGPWREQSALTTAMFDELALLHTHRLSLKSRELRTTPIITDLSKQGHRYFTEYSYVLPNNSMVSKYSVAHTKLRLDYENGQQKK